MTMTARLENLPPLTAATNITNLKLAIVGMASCWGTCDGLDAFERSIYEGQQHFEPISPQQWQMIQSGTLTQSAADPQSMLVLNIADRALGNLETRLDKVGAILTGMQKFPAQEVQQAWGLTMLSLTPEFTDTSLFQLLDIAKGWLMSGDVEAALVGAVQLPQPGIAAELGTADSGVTTLSYGENAGPCQTGEGAGAVVVKLLQTALEAGDRIYAVIDASCQIPLENIEQPAAPAIQQAAAQALRQANLEPQDIGYLEVFASGIPQEDEDEVQGLLQTYRTPTADLSCALGSVKASIGHLQAATGIASLIKTALCLYHRFLPVTPHWSGVKSPHDWQGSPFYVPTESRPWFLGTTDRRIAALSSLDASGHYSHFVISEEPSQRNRRSQYLQQMPLYLFPVAGDTESELITDLQNLHQKITEGVSLAVAAQQTFTAFQAKTEAPYALAILGHTPAEVLKEIQLALKGVITAFESGRDWQTPTGSYFSATPLGRQGGIAFLYPGAFGTHVGLGRNLFKLFPDIYEDTIIQSFTQRLTTIERQLYPRSLAKLSLRDLEKLEQQLMADILTLLESEMGFARVLTTILKDNFQLQPTAVFGYSLGEITMMCAQGVWSDMSQNSRALHRSALFSTSLAGPMNAVCKSWGLPQDRGDTHPELWHNYILIASAAAVRDCLHQEQRVYLTQINSAKEVMIGGDPQSCQRVITALGCDAIRAPFNYAIHCQPVQSEYDELLRLNTWPAQPKPGVSFYSAATNAPIPLESETIGHSIAQTLSQPIDFPRLLNRIYNDGNRIFLEVGAGGMCTRWVDEALKQQPHLTISLNRRGVDDYTTLIKAMAKLLSHRVSLDLSQLYEQHKSSPQNPNPKSPNLKNLKQPTHATVLFRPQDQQKQHQFLQKLSANTSQQAKNHAKFLADRHQALLQISNLIELQTDISEQLLKAPTSAH
jgi:PfaB family protein